MSLLVCAAAKAPRGLRAQSAPTQATQARPTSSPYSGDLSIFEYPDRDKKLQIDRVMNLLGITNGKSVADIGAGSGWFTVRRRGVSGQRGPCMRRTSTPRAIEYIDERATKEKLTNVQTVLGTPDDPKLRTASVDAMLLLKVYHEIAHPVPVMKTLRASLKPGGKVGDHRPQRQWDGPRIESRDRREGDGRGGIQAAGEVRLYQGGWAGLLPDLQRALKAIRIEQGGCHGCASRHCAQLRALRPCLQRRCSRQVRF